MADTKEELTLIRMLIEQNGEILQLMRTTMEKREEQELRETERFKELMELIKMSGAIDLIGDRLRRPRLVPSKPEEKCPKCNGSFGKPKFVKETHQVKDGARTTIREEHLLYTCDACEFTKTGPTAEQKEKESESQTG